LAGAVTEAAATAFGGSSAELVVGLELFIAAITATSARAARTPASAMAPR
jgi:hypothetical protein